MASDSGSRPPRGYAFSSYAYPAIERHVWQAVKQSERAEQSAGVMVASAMIDETDPAAVWEAALVRASLYQQVGRLPEGLQRIIIA